MKNAHLNTINISTPPHTISEPHNLSVLTNETLQPKQRYSGIDLVRLLAMFLVVAVHSYLSGYYAITSITPPLLLPALFRWICMTCIPLFLIITGYLQKNKAFSKKHYMGLIRILLEYLLCSLICLAYRYFRTGISFVDVIKSIFKFAAAPYSWYINMFIGLYILIPFLNLLYNNITSKKLKIVFISLLIFVLSLPATISIAPNYWVIAYPIMYYYIGCFIRDFKPKINKWVIACILFAILIMQLLIELLPLNGILNGSTINNHSSIFCLITSVCLFLLIYDITIKNKKFSKFIQTLSSLSLSTFLLSWIFDQVIYWKILNKFFTTYTEKLPHLLYIVPIIFILSMALAFIVNKLTDFIFWISKKINDKILNKTNINKKIKDSL